MEEWRDIEGYEGLYEVSSEGRIRSVDRVVEYSNGRNHFYKSKLLRQLKDRDGYMVVNLYKEKTSRQYRVHRLVAEAFLPNPDNLPVCNHKDENPSNNNVENLEYCTQKYNVNYGTSQLRRADAISKPVYQYTLDNQLVKVWKSVTECRLNGFCGVSGCCRGKRNKHKGYKWSYIPL